MVDVSTYKLMHPYTSAPRGPTGPSPLDKGHANLDPWPMRVNKSEELSEKAYMLLPTTIFGFRLQAKKWSKHTPSLFYVNETTSCVSVVYELIVISQPAC